MNDGREDELRGAFQRLLAAFEAYCATFAVSTLLDPDSTALVCDGFRENSSLGAALQGACQSTIGSLRRGPPTPTGLGDGGILPEQGGLAEEVEGRPVAQVEGDGTDRSEFGSLSLSSHQDGDRHREGGPQQSAKRKSGVLGSARNLMRRRHEAPVRKSRRLGGDDQEPGKENEPGLN